MPVLRAQRRTGTPCQLLGIQRIIARHRIPDQRALVVCLRTGKTLPAEEIALFLFGKIIRDMFPARKGDLRRLSGQTLQGEQGHRAPSCACILEFGLLQIPPRISRCHVQLRSRKYLRLGQFFDEFLGQGGIVVLQRQAHALPHFGFADDTLLHRLREQRRTTFRHLFAAEPHLACLGQRTCRIVLQAQLQGKTGQLVIGCSPDADIPPRTRSSFRAGRDI